MEIERPKKNPSFYECKICNFLSFNKKDYRRHIFTRKHLDNVAGNVGKLCGKPQKSNTSTFNCSCSREYKTLSGLWKHKKLCNFIENNMDTNNQQISNQITPELVLSVLHQNKEVLEQNKELTNLVLEQNKTIIELAKNSQGQTINSHNINSNNKTFNLNVFLNEYYKDAMNITNFVDSLKLQVSDLENMGKVGFVEGITSIIVKNLQALDIYKRPVHCADKKREVIYIKDEDK
jgi:hypothetical protein